MKKCLVINLFILCFIITYSQKSDTKKETNSDKNHHSHFVNKQLENRGEIYFSFKINDLSLLYELTEIISIDKVISKTVYAYANKKGFDLFLEYGLDYIPVYCYYKPSKSLTMATTVEQMSNWDRYPTHDVYMQIMNDFVANYPDMTRLDTIGFSVNNYPIVCLAISNDIGLSSDKPKFLWSGTMHGDEIAGYVILLRFADYLLSNYGKDNQVTNMLNQIEIFINPLANPDGTYYDSPDYSSVANSIRYNLNSYDLNRNYPRIDGEATNIEPEIQAMMDYTDNIGFVMSGCVHGGIEFIMHPWGFTTEPPADYDWWQYVSWIYATNAQQNSPEGYFDYAGGVIDGNSYFVNGSKQDFMNYFRNSREATLELSNQKRLEVQYLNNHWNYNKQALLDYTEQILYGFRGLVTDACSGQPIPNVKVYIQGHDKQNSEVYSFYPLGNYHRLIYEGVYDVKFSADGYKDFTTSVSVLNNNSTRLDVELMPANISSPDFKVSSNNIIEGQAVNFFDLSNGDIDSWLWTFVGAVPNTSNEKNPENIIYYNEGTYDVSLEITTNACTIIRKKADFINVVIPEPPIADFISDIQSTCIGIVQFQDESIYATSWLWEFGDGNTSTKQNPTHQYSTNGVYTVSLTVANNIAENTNIKNNYITIDLPDAPNTTSKEACGQAELTLYAEGEGVLNWYDESSAGNLINTGNFLTDTFTETTNYYIDATVIHTEKYFGGKSNNSGYGEYWGSDEHQHGLIFNAMQEFKLSSVKVYAETEGERTISLRSSSGDIIETKTINIATGESRIDLNINVPVDNNMVLRAEGNPQLFRNGLGVATYPYVINDILIITETTAAEQFGAYGLYYYFYDWEIIITNQCISPKSVVTAEIYPELFVNTETINESYIGASDGSATVIVSGGTPPYSYEWDTGSNNQTISGLNAGNYFVTVTDYNNCKATDNVEISVVVFSEKTATDRKIMIFPNPASDNITVMNAEKSNIQIINVLGEIIYNLKNAELYQNINISRLPNGIYFVKINSEVHKININR